MISSRSQRRTARCPRRTRLLEGTSARAMTMSPSPTPICPTAATATRLPSPPRTIEGHHRRHIAFPGNWIRRKEGRWMCCLLFKWKGSSPSSPTSLPFRILPIFHFLFDVWVSYPSLLSLCMRARHKRKRRLSLCSPPS